MRVEGVREGVRSGSGEVEEDHHGGVVAGVGSWSEAIRDLGGYVYRPFADKDAERLGGRVGD